MLGLIKKDLLIIKQNLTSILVVLVIFGIMMLQGQMKVSFVLPLICIMLFMSTFNYDSFNNWDAYACTLPNGRQNVVKSKYLATLILSIISTLVTAIILVIAYFVNKKLGIDEITSSLMGSLFAVVLLESFMYPFIFKYGVEKGRLLVFVGIFALTAIVGLGLKGIDLFNNYYFLILPGIMIIMLLISYQISKRIYLKKEF